MDEEVLAKTAVSRDGAGEDRFSGNGDGAENDVFFRLRRGAIAFSRAQRTVCAYILENYRKVAFVTVEELAGLCGASPATVVRTAKSLGYASYGRMQAEFENLMLRTQVPLWWAMERAWGGDAAAEEEDFPLPWVAQDNIEAIRDSITPQLVEGYRRAVDMLAGARRRYVLGMRSSRGASLFFHSMLHQLLPDVYLAPDGIDALFDDLVDLEPTDVLFCIQQGGPHYTQSTTKAVAYAARNGVPSVLVSSSPNAPAAAYATLTLPVPPAGRHYSIVPCMTLLESLIVSIGRRTKQTAERKLRKLEDVLNDEHILG